MRIIKKREGRKSPLPKILEVKVTKVSLVIFLLFSSLWADYKFNKIASLPYGISAADEHIDAGDTDHNGLNEIVFTAYLRICEGGVYKHALLIYESKPINNYELVYAETLYVPPSPEKNYFYFGGICDIDKDRLSELAGIAFKGEAYTFWIQTRESPNYNDYPTVVNWETKRDSVSSTLYPTLLTDFDRDGKNEIWTEIDVYMITEIYENVGNNYNALVLSDSNGPFGSYFCGDFDEDGKNEIVCGAVIFENTEGNQYEEIWRDSISLKNGHDRWPGNDCDGDGKPEFFVGYKNPLGGHVWMTYLFQYETIGNNLYKRVLVDSFNQSGIFIARQSDCGDVDGDGQEEIVWSLGTDVIVLKATGDDKYERVWQWHNDLGGEYQSVRALCYDLNKNGYDEIVLSGEGATQIWEIDKASIPETQNPSGKPLVSYLYPNIPNPFNNQTTIKYQIAGTANKISLRFYDVSGRLVRDFTKTRNHEPGVYTLAWDGRDDNGSLLPVGIYFLELLVTSGNRTDRFSKKIVLYR